VNTDEIKRILHRLGYYSYLDGLIRRYPRQKGMWDSHLENSRRFILQAVERVKPGKVTVLGSGWLLDFPLAEILEKGIGVTLVDIIHPPELKKQVAGHANVTLVEEDVTGGLIGEVWEKAGRLPFYRKLRSPGDLNVPEFSAGDNPGLIISLNILSQLDVLPVRFLRKKADADEKEFNKLREKIHSAHIRFLQKHTSVLITDYEEVTFGKDDEATTEPTVLTPLPEGALREDWVWDFDLTGTDSYSRRSVLKVAAILIRNQTPDNE